MDNISDFNHVIKEASDYIIVTNFNSRMRFVSAQTRQVEK